MTILRQEGDHYEHYNSNPKLAHSRIAEVIQKTCSTCENIISMLSIVYICQYERFNKKMIAVLDGHHAIKVIS